MEKKLTKKIHTIETMTNSNLCAEQQEANHKKQPSILGVSSQENLTEDNRVQMNNNELRAA